MGERLNIKGDDRLAASAGAAAVAVALMLAVAKLWALRETGSLGVAASLADSAIDAVASLAGLAAVLYASKPPDEEHAFGHGSAEDLASLGQAGLVALSGLLIGWQAIRRLLLDAPPPLAREELGMGVMAFSIVMTLGLVWWQLRVARKTGSPVVVADSLHYLSDLLPNIGAMAALAASAWFGISDLDSLVGLAAAGLLLAGAFRVARRGWRALMDHGADAKTLRRLQEIADGHPGLSGYHDLKTRTSGRRLFVQIHVELPGDLPLREAHDIGAALRHRMLDAFPDAEVIVHKDPV
ncbi:cation diffusion facilitator family transporter [Albimonas sp. CAU 1670]|uniref:cation diffusion facilitator family transporter n=1 Tax=Albimonas sp. CAU 1670 TaxID=3032599 RepID=UPI0023DBB81C|nr:cation diffusion facilitator family transporter [Albimonas sp. CAU 1670]MDF2234408.1 cation diffusion facilitator family transporter [Albimonas sp. CAU 1670]